MSRLFSVCIGVAVSAILVKPDILLWIPALNSPHVDMNVGVISILLAVWTIVRDSLRERENRLKRENELRERENRLKRENEFQERINANIQREMIRAMLFSRTLEHDVPNTDDGIRGLYDSSESRIMYERAAPEEQASYVKHRTVNVTNILLRGAMIVTAGYFFVRLFVG